MSHTASVFSIFHTYIYILPIFSFCDSCVFVSVVRVVIEQQKGLRGQWIRHWERSLTEERERIKNSIRISLNRPTPHYTPYFEYDPASFNSVLYLYYSTLDCINSYESCGQIRVLQQQITDYFTSTFYYMLHKFSVLQDCRLSNILFWETLLQLQ